MDWAEAFPVRRPVPWRTLDTEALVVDVKSGLLYPLNSVGARIWELCDGARSVDDIVHALAHEFDAEDAVIRRDAERFIDELTAARHVEIATGPSTEGG